MPENDHIYALYFCEIIIRYAEIAATWLQVARQVQIYFILAGSFYQEIRMKCCEIAILVVLKLST